LKQDIKSPGTPKTYNNKFDFEKRVGKDTYSSLKPVGRGARRPTPALPQ
jgi:hypothetical protein